MGLTRTANGRPMLQLVIRRGVSSIHSATGFVLVCGAFLVAACSTATELTAEQTLPLSGQAATLFAPGPFDYVMEPGEHRGEHGCALAYETYRPTQGGESMVFLAHGFLRNLERMRGWAEHWASHGVAVTVLSLCNSTLVAGHHDRNAEDIVALAQMLHDGPLIYAGFSAGGLAAHVAAANDTRTIGYLGLDSVDHRGLARETTPRSDYPALLLLAEPSSCNGKNNMLDATAGVPDLAALRIKNSTHCHFENPYDSRCEIACGSVRPRESQIVLIETVRSLATAWILELAPGVALPGQGDLLSRVANGEWQTGIEIVR